MDWQKLTDDIVTAAAAAFGSLMTEKSDEHFYAFSLYTDEFAETISPSSNTIERYHEKIYRTGVTHLLDIASCRWSTAEWAYEAKNARLFSGIYRDLEKHRKSLPTSQEALESYKKSVHQCMISALKKLDEDRFFAQRREYIVLFISSSDDDEAFDMENASVVQLNSERIYAPFLKRYGDDSAAGC